jgi:hypothetical protein
MVRITHIGDLLTRVALNSSKISEELRFLGEDRTEATPEILQRISGRKVEGNGRADNKDEIIVPLMV